MAIIQEILGTDPFSGSRIVINSNFLSLKTELETLENNLGISVQSGNIDISGATGGELKAKIGAFDTLQTPSYGVSKFNVNGNGIINAEELFLSTSLLVPTITADYLNLTALGSSVFNGEVSFNSLIKINNGLSHNKVNVGTLIVPTATHNIINSDRVVLFSLDVAGTLMITPDVSLVDGHVVTLVSTSDNLTMLDTTYIMGFLTGSITFAPAGYKSSITLMWSLADLKWIIIGSSNITIA